MDDAFTFAEKGDHSYEIPLLLVMAIVDEVERGKERKDEFILGCSHNEDIPSSS